ncbi:MAG TPA: cell envelope integrity protein TolA [Desulfohalobiaceae bacterium]|nr:cell envelope integrity protein TolA [Desulfohalobiaceae bacterium]
MHITSCILSLLFHICVLVLILYFPFQEVSHQIDLDKKVYQVEIYKMPQKDEGKDSSKKVHKQREVKHSQKSPPSKARAKPSKLPALKKDNISSQKTRTKQKPTKIAKRSKPKPRAKVPSKEISKQEKKNNKKTAQNAPTKKNIVSNALDEVKKSIESEENVQSNIVDQEMASLRRSLREGEYNASQSLEGDYTAKVYGNIVEQEIKNNWRFPMVDSELALRAEVEVQIDPNGSIIGFQLISKSGREDFDTSVLRAVENTKVLPPPPRKDLKTIQITFNLQDQKRF